MRRIGIMSPPSTFSLWDPVDYCQSGIPIAREVDSVAMLDRLNDPADA